MYFVQPITFFTTKVIKNLAYQFPLKSIFKKFSPSPHWRGNFLHGVKIPKIQNYITQESLIQKFIKSGQVVPEIWAILGFNKKNPSSLGGIFPDGGSNFKKGKLKDPSISNFIKIRNVERVLLL